MDRGAWWATVHGVGITRSDTIYQPSIHTHTTKVNSVYERKSIDGVYKALGLWCLTVGGGGWGLALLSSSNPRSRGLAAGAELPKGLHKSSSSDIFRSNSH